MGTIYTAICECGLCNEVFTGGGILPGMDKFPFLCESCHDITTVNLLDQQWQCLECHSIRVIPYDAILSNSANKNWTVMDEQNRERKLTQENFRCPRCGQMTLRFVLSDYWY